jgi:hypothetical protein
MAKRKTPRPGTRAGGRGTAAPRTAKGSSARRGTTKASTRAGTGSRAGAAGGRIAKKAAGTSATARRAATKASASRKAGPKAAKPSTPKRTAAKTGRGVTKTLSRRQSAGRAAGTAKTTRKATTGRSPSTPRRQALGTRSGRVRRSDIERDRRLLEETVDTPPSSLDLDRRPSAARSGRTELEASLTESRQTAQGITAGDVDADWESAFSTGDEAPGGDMPTPDKSVVEDIGAALGVEYQDNEELKGVDKIEERDRHRWEFDPASSEDYQERTKRKQ